MRRFDMRVQQAIGKPYVESVEAPDGAWCLVTDAAKYSSDLCGLLSRFAQITARLDDYYLGGAKPSETLVSIRSAADELASAAAVLSGGGGVFPVREKDMGAAYMAGYAAATRALAKARKGGA